MKHRIEPTDQTCKRCGGMHFGSYGCPYLDVAVCFACLKNIAAENGSDSDVHPNRKFDELGRVYHTACPFSEIKPYQRLAGMPKTVTDHKYISEHCHENGCQYLVLEEQLRVERSARERAMEFGQHKDYCNKFFKIVACNCGWDELRAALTPPTSERKEARDDSLDGSTYDR